MDENKRKHLEFIQGVVTRLAGNLFFLRGWAVTLITGLFALSSKEANSHYSLLGYLLLVIFWVLDGYFLSKERQFRALYDEVRLKKDVEIDFSMNISKYVNLGNRSFPRSLFSLTLAWFYGSLLILIIIIKFL